MAQFFTTFFYQPVFNLLIFLYNNVALNDLGISIVLMTIVIRLIFSPLSKKSIKSQKELQELQPKINELKKKYAKDKEKLGKEMMNLYSEHKINPFSSCLPLFIQLPFFIAIFRIFKKPITSASMNLVYPFINAPLNIQNIGFGVLNLSEPSVILALLAGISQFWQTKMIMETKKDDETEKKKDDNSISVIMNKQMLYMMPIFIVFIGLSFPAALTLYMVTFNVTMGIQQYYIFKQQKDNNNKANNTLEGEIIK